MRTVINKGLKRKILFFRVNVRDDHRDHVHDRDRGCVRDLYSLPNNKYIKFMFVFIFKVNC